MIKPFHFQNYKDAIYQALQNKVKPSPSWRSLKDAKKLDPNPALCFYYLGEVYSKQVRFDEAIKSYEDGIALNPKDYRCLNGIFDLKMKRSDYESAYEIAKQILQFYPVSPKIILELVKVSIYTQKFGDVCN